MVLLLKLNARPPPKYLQAPFPNETNACSII